jgi:hypothetical protein
MNRPCCLVGAAWCGRGRARWGKHPAAGIKEMAHRYVAALSVWASAPLDDDARGGAGTQDRKMADES